MALELLRANNSAAAHESSPPGTVVVPLSPLATATCAVLSRAVAPLWGEAIFAANNASPFRLDVDTLQAVEATLTELKGVLGRLQGEVWVDNTFAKYPHRWEPHAVSVTMPAAVNLGQYGGSAFTPNDTAHLLSARIAAVVGVTATARELCVFLRHVADVYPEVLDKAVKGDGGKHAALTFRELVQKPELAAEFGRKLARDVRARPESFIASHVQQLELLFGNMQRLCPALFTATDSLESEQAHILARLGKVAASGSLPSGSVQSVYAKLYPSAAALWQSGGLEDVADKLMAVGHAGEAVRLHMHAARQLDASGDAGYDAAAATLRQKETIISRVRDMLETLWMTDRAAFDALLPSQPIADASATLWDPEAADEAAHALVFDWLVAPREVEHFVEHLRHVLIFAASPFLEHYLNRHQERLGSERALFLLKRKGDRYGALQAYAQLAHSALPTVAADQRLEHRIACLGKALGCADVGGEYSAEAARVKGLMAQLDVQRRLLAVTAGFLESRHAGLDQPHPDGGTQREAVAAHVAELQNSAVDSKALFHMAHLYRHIGGADVQLRILCQHRITDAAQFRDVLDVAFRANRPLEDIAADVLQHYEQNGVFPLQLVAMKVEAEYFAAAPRGSVAAVELLTGRCRLPPPAVAEALREMAEGVVASSAAKVASLDAGYSHVSVGYAVHSYAAAVHAVVVSRQRAQAELSRAALRSAFDLVELAQQHGDRDAECSAALDAANRLLQECETAFEDRGGRSGTFGYLE
jgi:hypothetical protein